MSLGIKASGDVGATLGRDDDPKYTGDPDDTDDSTTDDDATSGLKLWADVGLKIGKDIDGLTNQTKKLLAKLEKNTPVDYAVVASGVAVDGQPLLLLLGQPDAGTFWEVESCAVGGVDYDVTVTGSAGLYVSAYPADAGSGMINLADYAATLPNVGFYGSRSIVVNDAEYLFVIVNGGYNAVTYVANAQVTVFDSRAAGGRVETRD